MTREVKKEKLSENPPFSLEDIPFRIITNHILPSIEYTIVLSNEWNENGTKGDFILFLTKNFFGYFKKDRYRYVFFLFRAIKVHAEELGLKSFLDEKITFKNVTFLRGNVLKHISFISYIGDDLSHNWERIFPTFKFNNLSSLSISFRFFNILDILYPHCMEKFVNKMEAKNLKRLKLKIRANFGRIRDFSENSISQSFGEVNKQFLKKFPKLKHLKLKGEVWDVKNLLKNEAQLHSLHLNKCKLLDGTEFNDFNISSLKKLSISGNVKPSFLSNLFSNKDFKCLTYLNLMLYNTFSDMDIICDFNVNEIINSNRLRYISLDGFMIKNINHFYRFKYLESLTLRNCKVIPYVKGNISFQILSKLFLCWTDPSLILKNAIIKGDMGCEWKFWFGALPLISKPREIQNVHRLKFFGVDSNKGDEFFRMFLFKGLKILSIQACGEEFFNIKGTKWNETNCKDLVKLKIVGMKKCIQICDDIFTTNMFTSLRILKISYCPYIRGGEWNVLPNLENLLIKSCYNFDNDGMFKVHTFPKLKVLMMEVGVENLGKDWVFLPLLESVQILNEEKFHKDIHKKFPKSANSSLEKQFSIRIS